MALALSGTAPAAVSGSGATITTASFTPPASALLVACHIWNTSSNAQPAFDTVADSVSGTWTQRVVQNVSPSSTGGVIGQPGGASIWTSTAANTARTVSGTNNTAGLGHQLMVFVLTDTSTPTVGQVAEGHNASGLPTTGSITGLTVGSYVFACSDDWAAVGPASTSYTPNTGQTVGAQVWVSTQYGGAIWRTTSTLAGTTQTMDLTGPAGQNENIVAIEIKATTAGTVAYVPHMTVLRQAMNRAASF